jgi:hypothetical protein
MQGEKKKYEITRKSALTGKYRTMKLPVNITDLTLWLNGTHIQHAMPYLTPSEREFLLNGTHPSET